jgi:hypothetical protein
VQAEGRSSHLGAPCATLSPNRQAKPPSQARTLKEKYDAERAGGVYLSWRTVGGMAFVGLGASMYIASKIGSPSRKGYEQVFVPKDH